MSEHATAASYTAAGFTTTWGIFTVQEWGIVAGIVIGIATWATNRHYRKREDARQVELAELDKRIKTAQARREEAQLEALRRD